MAAPRRDQLDPATADRNRAVVSRAGIELDLELTRRNVAAAKAMGRVPDELASRLDGLVICRRLLDRPERCARRPDFV
jgi:hypothetical protein